MDTSSKRDNSDAENVRFASLFTKEFGVAQGKSLTGKKLLSLVRKVISLRVIPSYENRSTDLKSTYK